MTNPGWFDWLSLGVTLLAAAAPVYLAIVLFSRERRERIEQARSVAWATFTARLERLDEAGMLLARMKYLGEFWQAMGPGVEPLIRRIEIHLDWAREDGEYEDNPDVPIETQDDIRRSILSPTYRANLIEVYLANGEVTLAEEDSLMISPSSRERAEDDVLQSPEYREWVRGTRLAPWRIRARRLRRWGLRQLPKLVRSRFNVEPDQEPLNPLALRNWMMNGEEHVIEGDPWLADRMIEV